VRFYYSYSPPVAEFIANHDTARVVGTLEFAAACGDELDGPAPWSVVYSGTYGVANFSDGRQCSGCPEEDAAQTPGLGRRDAI
jgi:hypothetical protein